MSRRHKKGHAEAHADERWLLTYADMITLLMVFFIVLYAISNTDLRKFTALAQSVSAAFNTDVFSGSQAVTVMSGAESAPGASSFDSGGGAVGSDSRAIEAALRDYAIREGIEAGVSVEVVPEGVAIRISESLLFSSGRASLTETSQKLLRRVVDAVRPLPNGIRVEGHTDDLPPSGPFYRDNWELSSARAIAVLRAMVTDGIAAARMSAAGFAEFHPVAANSDEAARNRNRRVDVVILYPNARDSVPADAERRPIPELDHRGGAL